MIDLTKLNIAHQLSNICEEVTTIVRDLSRHQHVAATYIYICHDMINNEHRPYALNV